MIEYLYCTNSQPPFNLIRPVLFYFSLVHIALTSKEVKFLVCRVWILLYIIIANKILFNVVRFVAYVSRERFQVEPRWARRKSTKRFVA